MTKIFKVPFGTQGDRAAIPDDIQADGALSYVQGYGYGFRLQFPSYQENLTFSGQVIGGGNGIYFTKNFTISQRKSNYDGSAKISLSFLK